MISNASVRGKLLVIDDEVGPRESLRMVFKNDYDVVLADSVDEGLEHLRKESPDAIIMDIRMPGKSGIDGLKEIRAIDPIVSVVMLTGFGALETAQQAIRLGANDYLKKPFDTNEIQEIIDRNVQRTRLERRRLHIAEELRKLNTELVNELTVKEHMATLGHASSEFVHDLRNPLTVVHGYAQLLEEQLGTVKEKIGDQWDETYEFLNIISRNVERCYDLTEMWRNGGKGDKDSRRFTRLTDIADDVIKGIEPFAASLGARIQPEFEEEAGEVFMDAAQVYRAVQNLVTNALHALPEQGGIIRLCCGRENGSCFIRVTDNGCGMSEEQVSHIFEPYYTTKDVSRGTGLGLAITKKVIECHDGRIDVESSPGCGTTFTVWLPISAGAGVPAAAKTSTVPIGVTETGTLA